MNLLATCASDNTFCLFDDDGNIVADYLPTPKAIVSALSDIAMYKEVKITAREAWLFNELSQYGVVTT